MPVTTAEARPETATQPQASPSERIIRPWRETILLAPGSRSGIGFALVTDLLRTTDIPTVFMGSRTQEKFDQSVRKLQETVPNLNVTRVQPFLADFSHPSEAVEVYQQIEDRGIQVTDVWDFSAAGVDWLNNRDLVLRPLMVLGRLNMEGDLPKDNKRLVALQQHIEQQVEVSMPYAKAVNFDGPRELYEYMETRLPDEAFMGFESSLWSTFRINVPRFYRATAETKGIFEDHMDARASHFASLGINPAIVSGHLTMDTVVGKIIEKYIFSMLEDPSKRAEAVGYGIPEADMARATRMALESNPDNWPTALNRWFVYGEGGATQITNRLSAEHKMFQDKLLV